MDDDRGLFRELIGDGRPALSLTAVGLVLSGAFAIFLSFRREFLPHDVSYLGMSAAELCGFADCRVVRFMFHDRVAFGGSLIAIGVLYFWLAAFPLRQRAAWAWCAFVASGALGFASFLAYLGYGYLDSEDIIAAIRNRPVSQSVIVTGRGAGEALLGIADTVSDIHCEKHAFAAGIKARKGIEY